MRLQRTVATSEKFTVQLSGLYIVDITSFGSADSVRRAASNNGVGQFKAISQVEGNTFRPIFFGYFIAD